MSTLLHWFTSPEWAQVVKALLHSLWQGALIALVLAIGLKRLSNPVARYRSSFAALMAIVFAAIITWAIINNSPRRAAPPAHNQPLITQPPAPDSTATPEPESPPETVVLATHKPTNIRWTAWLAFAWFAGAILMLTRAGFKVAAAEQLRRSCRPLDDSTIEALLAETRRALGIANRIRVGITDKLTSPAVVGIVVPMLILPLALLTTLTPEQIRFVLLHELAHIRRRDYLANLFQFVAESLLFFNPAIWWISHQIRREREACCDALATELSGAPADYAQTLVHVAEKILYPAPTAAPAFGDKREPSSLAERIQRLLVPGYRPSLRLTWRAMLAALIFGSVLLFLSAVGTRITIAAILTPQQRIAEIEKKNVEYGQNPAAAEGIRTNKTVSVTARIRTPDGSPLPKGIYATLYSRGGAPENRSTVVSWARVENDGTISNTVSGDRIWVQAGAAGFAPTVVGPFDATGTNRLDAGELVLDRGFDVWLKITDARSGAIIRAPMLHTQSWLRDAGIGMQGPVNIISDSSGRFVMSPCVDEPLDITINARGYQIAEQHFEHLHSGETLNIALKHGAQIAGIVTDKTTGDPISGATVRMIYQKGTASGHYEWNDPMRLLATTGNDGRFMANQLLPATMYCLGVSAPEHQSIILSNLFTGERDVNAQLGPELIVRGQVVGDVKGLQRYDNHFALYRTWSEVFDNNSWGNGEMVPLKDVNGIMRFEFTNRTAGAAQLVAEKGRTFERQVDTPIDNWVIDLNAVQKTAAVSNNVPKREVIFRFKDRSGVPPQGTVSISIAVPDNPAANHLTAHSEIDQITNGEVHAQIDIGDRISAEPAAMIGYWFSWYGVYDDFGPIEVTNGPGSMIIEVPVVPAGAIYAQARNADGSPAGGLFFGIQELKRAPGRPDNTPLNNGGDGFSDNLPRKWVSPPLPLGGTYRITGWRGNSICISKPITLTGENPTAEVELQFAPTKTLEGTLLDSNGRPVPNANLRPSFSLAQDNNFGLNPVFTDADGRFIIENVTIGLGDYFIEPLASGVMAEHVKLDFKTQPQTIRLKPGRTIAGRLIESGTSNVISGAEIRALNFTNLKLPTVTTTSDANGHFEFSQLAAGDYRIFVEGGAPTASQQTYRGNVDTNITLAVKLYPWSTVKPAPRASASVTNSGTYEASGSNTIASVKTIREDQIEAAQIVQDGKLLFQLGKFDEAEAKFRQALKSDPDNQSARYYFSLIKRTRIRNATDSGSTNLFTRTFKLDPNNFYMGLQNLGLITIPAPIGRASASTNHGPRSISAVISSDPTPAIRTAFTKLFADIGVTFSPPKSVFYNDRQYILTVRATAADLNMIEAALDTLNTAPPEVTVRVRFVDLTQEDSKALGFQWYLGNFLMDGSRITNSGSSQPSFRNTPSDKNLKGAFPGSAPASTGIASQTTATIHQLTVSGVLTDPQFRVVLNALQQGGGAESLKEGQVTTLSGRQAQFQIVDELTGTNAVITNHQGQIIRYTYDTNTEPAGVFLDVRPEITADESTVQLALVATVREFAGYARGPILDGVHHMVPIYREAAFTNNCTLWDGQTVVFGGLMTNEVPVLGDLPMVGRLFTSNSTRTQRNNIMIFVTPTLIDAVGNLLHPPDANGHASWKTQATSGEPSTPAPSQELIQSATPLSQEPSN